MGSPKALLDFRGETFLDRLIGLFSTVCDPVIVVLGNDAERIRTGLRRADEARFVVNPDPDRGMLRSFQCAFHELPASADGVLFTLVDHPAVDAATLASLAASFIEHAAPVTKPVYDGRRGHPVCIARQVADEILSLRVDAQVPDVLTRYRDVTRLVLVEDPGVLEDVDDPAAYAKLIEAAVRT
ncbi:MAG: nucleotidyltransferase family protein [Acidobacteriota bacterium]|nr:nucleotidyltransferase family protein [Acidobacteriota bacterium]